MKIKIPLLCLAIVVLLNSCQQPKTGDAKVESVAGEMDRTVLPIKEPDYPFDTTLDARNAKAPAHFEVRAPAKAPNVVVVLIDDQGFGQSSAFGGPCYEPTLEKLAATGLKYNNFNTTALCSPTRVALLTGRNHHLNQWVLSWNL
jgi:arylsulfatase